jgi:quercetin dioxygenase-like cupin family protein
MNNGVLRGGGEDGTLTCRRLTLLTHPFLAILALGAVLAGIPCDAAASDAVVAELMARDLIGLPGKEVTLQTVEYPPGGKSPPHRHHAQVFVYVLEGSLRMQVQGSPVVTLGPGATFYESPDDTQHGNARWRRWRTVR